MKIISFDAYKLKWIAVIGMIMNHIAIAFYPILSLWILLPLYAAGGLTYTIMAFFVVDGYRHTSSLKKYITRLLIFGLIAQAFHPMVLGKTAVLPGLFMNILFAIILSLIVLFMYDRIKIRILFWLLFIIACIVSLFMDLLIVSVLVPLLYYVIKKENTRRTLPGIISGIFWILLGGISILGIMTLKNTPGMEQELQIMLENLGFGMELIIAAPTFSIGCFLGAILIKNYSGDRGKSAKWLFYVAYPLHLAIIAFISIALGLIEFSLFGF